MTEPGAQSVNTIEKAKIFVNDILEKTGLNGRPWTTYQMVSLGGDLVAQPADPYIKIAMASNMVIDADEFKLAMKSYIWPTCNYDTHASIDDMVNVCMELYNNNALTEWTVGNCTMTQFDIGFGIKLSEFTIAASPVPISAFHYNEVIQISKHDSESVMGPAYRNEYVHNWWALNKCQASIATDTWENNPVAALSLSDENYKPKFAIYDEPNNIPTKYPCST
tara:strand:- start:109 stop:774 length:666 start_codon:yes stop_codon:yes gene_type:complete